MMTTCEPQVRPSGQKKAKKPGRMTGPKGKKIVRLESLLGWGNQKYIPFDASYAHAIAVKPAPS